MEILCSFYGTARTKHSIIIISIIKVTGFTDKRFGNLKPHFQCCAFCLFSCRLFSRNKRPVIIVSSSSLLISPIQTIWRSLSHVCIVIVYRSVNESLGIIRVFFHNPFGLSFWKSGFWWFLYEVL